MTAKKTHQQYEEELFLKEIECVPLETYAGSTVPILHECYEGHTWMGRPNDILRGFLCAKCSSIRQTKTHERYIQEIELLNLDCIPLETYKNSKTSLLHKCSRGHEWKALPAHIVEGHGCHKCNLVGGYNKTRFLRDRILAESPGILYLIVLVKKSTSERSCLKIGITKGTSNKDVLRRASGFTGYEPRIQKLVYGTLEEVFELEQKLHHQWKDFRYLESHKFGGSTELFKIEKLSEILKSVPKTT